MTSKERRAKPQTKQEQPVHCPECGKVMRLDKVIWNDYKYYCKECEMLYELDFQDYLEEDEENT